MSNPRNPFNYPLNPDYGKGAFYRKIRLETIEGGVKADLEDCNHGFSVTVWHDGKHVTGLEPVHHRIPFTTCGGASEPLKKIIGLPLGLESAELISLVDVRANCTHWLDLSLLAIQHAAREEPVREYLVEIPDENDRLVTATVFCNQQVVHQWRIQDWVIHEPEAIKDNTLFKGFSAWANNAFSDADEKEAAFVLQKGYFVSRARLYDISQLTGEPALNHHMMHGACFSYSSPQLEEAKRTRDSIRDFTGKTEQLLTFK